MVICNMKKSRLFHISALTHTICDANGPSVYFPPGKILKQVHNAGAPLCHGLQSCGSQGKNEHLPDGSGNCQRSSFHAGRVPVHQMQREVFVKGLILEGFACSKTAFTVHLLFNFLNSRIFLEVCFLQLDLLQLFFLTYVDDYFSCWPYFSAV